MIRASFSSFLRLSIAFFALTAGFSAYGQPRPGWWLPVDTVTSGPYEDHRPAITHSSGYYYGGLESWIVFERLTPSESMIAALKFFRNTSTFDTTVVTVATRGLPDLQTRPDIAVAYSWGPGGSRFCTMVAWQCFKHGRWQILYSSRDDSANSWSEPRLLVPDSLDNTDVRVSTVSDSLFLFTWKRRNTVMGLFQGFSTISVPETLAVSPADSLEYDVASRWSNIDLVWKSTVSRQDALLHRTIVRVSGTTMSEPDTVVIVPHLAAPRIAQEYGLAVLYEAPVDGKTDVFGTNRYSPGGTFRTPQNISADSAADDRNVRAFISPVVTKVDARQSTLDWYSDVTVYEKYRGADSMLIFLTGYQPYGERDTVRTRGFNRNAAISTDFAWGGPYARVPVVWESNRTGTSHIYARLVALVTGAAPGAPRRARAVQPVSELPEPLQSVDPDLLVHARVRHCAPDSV